MSAPSSERIPIFSFSTIRVIGSSMMGVVATTAMTIPAGVFSSAHCTHVMPSVCPARLLPRTHGQMRFHFSRETWRVFSSKTPPCERALNAISRRAK